MTLAAFRRMYGKCTDCGGAGFFWRTRRAAPPGAMLTSLVKVLCRKCGGTSKETERYERLERRFWNVALRGEE